MGRDNNGVVLVVLSAAMCESFYKRERESRSKGRVKREREEREREVPIAIERERGEIGVSQGIIGALMTHSMLCFSLL